jgi:hypothetical protein
MDNIYMELFKYSTQAPILKRDFLYVVIEIYVVKILHKTGKKPL